MHRLYRGLYSLSHGRVFTGIRAIRHGIKSMDKVVPASDVESIDKCVQILRNGGVIALPTDTIYGFAASALNSEAIERLYELKGRQSTKPIAICVGSADDVNRWSHCTVSRDLLNRLLPGPVTLIFNRRYETLSNPTLNPNTSTIGTRVPDHSFIVELAQKFNGPIGLTSANRSSEPSTLNIKEFEHMWNKLDAVVDGGTIEGDCRLGSTVVDLSTEGQYRIIRPGCAFEDTSQVLQEFGLSPQQP